jgi:predicted amidohydrolase YtcJ
MSLIERILYNGTIFTQDIYKPRVSALALIGERIVAYGSDDDVLPLADAATQRDNLQGATVIPGLTDAHIHWQQTAQSFQQVDLFEVSDKETALQRIAERAAQTPEGEWIRGWGWTQDIWPDKAFPTAEDLDRVAPKHPVYLAAKSVHAAWVNSLALRIGGVTDGIADPAGGQIQRGEAGKPTGILFEAPAMSLVYKNIPALTIERIAGAMKSAQDAALAVGLTGLHDFDDPDCLRALQLLRERGELSLRVVKNVNKGAIDAALESGLRWGFGDDWIRIGGVKLFADGALGPRTAAMIEPYEGEPDNYGIIVTDKEEIQEIVSRASAAGLPATVHAIGDRAVHDVLDVYEAVRAEEAARGEARPPRHRIEHVQLIHPSDVNRLASLDVIASMQPIHAMSDMDMAIHYWGERGQWSYNPRLQLKQGVVVAFGSDAPVDSYNPFVGIHAAVTRRRADGSPGAEGWYPEARVSIEDAVRAYTTGPAYAAGMESRLGRLAPGYLADLLVLDRDVFHIDTHDIRNVRVMATMVGGAWRYGGIGG